MVAATTVPAAIYAGVGAQLYHAKRHRSSWESMSVAASANKWIDQVGWCKAALCKYASSNKEDSK